jgi:hypothetical protein
MEVACDWIEMLHRREHLVRLRNTTFLPVMCHLLVQLSATCRDFQEKVSSSVKLVRVLVLVNASVR